MKNPIDLHFGGAGGAYFLASPGELVIDLEKRDRNIHDRRTDLRAVLLGPDREVLEDMTIPDAGYQEGLGPVQRVTLSTRVPRKGIYALSITISQDRYGEEIMWGLSTNCERYLIETSRGHKDARHLEPLVLLSPGISGEVCFIPADSGFELEISGLNEEVSEIPILDHTNSCVCKLTPTAEGNASHTFPAGRYRGGRPWRLQLSSMEAVIEIDGVTRWEQDDPYQHMSYWSPDLNTFFPLHQFRWLVTPYNRTLPVEPGQAGAFSFQVHNNSDVTDTFMLNLQKPDSSAASFQLKTNAVRLNHGKTADVVVWFTATEDPTSEPSIAHLEVSPRSHPDLSTFATLKLETGPVAYRKNLDLPLRFTPYLHENEQFGYIPNCPVLNQIYFDQENRPFVHTPSGVSALRDGNWTNTPLVSEEGTQLGARSTKIAFDSHNNVYILASDRGEPVLMHSSDGGKSFSTSRTSTGRGSRSSFDIEQFSGHNVPEYPPPVVRYTQTLADENLIWRRLNDMELFLPTVTGKGLEWGDPILVSDKCIGISMHSGIPSTVVSWGSKIHLVWAEATDPGVEVPGVPTFVATYDRETGILGESVMIGYGPPANDIHNTPCITIDGKGHLHVLVGTHGRPFPYAKSLNPDDVYSGWSDVSLMWPDARQTYIGLVCDPNDTLHATFRLWFEGTDYFPAGNYGTLSHQSKPAEGQWVEPRVLVVPPFSEYSVFYHRLTIDRTGRLFLCYDYYSTYWFYRNDYRGSRRSLLMSADAGQSWKLAETSDF
ncbi:MAG: hypothetical protein CME25_16550 [Gemmatimonadetes bacterium]|nr:hypothetical protein [Gemmatimonadota bacterium]